MVSKDIEDFFKQLLFSLKHEILAFSCIHQLSLSLILGLECSFIFLNRLKFDLSQQVQRKNQQRVACLLSVP